MKQFLILVTAVVWLGTSSASAAEVLHSVKELFSYDPHPEQPFYPPSAYVEHARQIQAEAQEQTEPTIYEPRPEFQAVIRGQTPQTYDLGPQSGQPGMMMSDPYSGMGSPYGGMQGNPYGPGPSMPQGQVMPPGYDPFMASPNAGMLPGDYGTVYGINGPQPARLGWTTRWDSVYVFPANLADGGKVSSSEIDWAADYVTQGPNGWLWQLTPEINYRNYNFFNPGFPLIAGADGISDNYYRFAYRFQTTTPALGPFSYRFGFTPAIATDFQRQLNSQAWNFDVDATMYLRTSPEWMWVAGVLYWERAKDYILPHAGVVWNPNQFWEIRAVYPNPRADVFVGTPFGLATWLYVGAEYNIESFQAGQVDTSKGQLQVREWRAYGGIRFEGCRFSSYIDFGYAFDRKWDLHGGFGSHDLAPKDAFMIRYGVRY